jgi:FkbM family methyltransferase
MGALRNRVEQAQSELHLVREGRGLRDRLRLVDMLVHSHLRVGRTRHLVGWVPSRRDEARDLRVGEWSLSARRGDGVVVYEQCGLDSYRADIAHPVRSVLDLGANVGLAALRFARRYPGARIVCVEADHVALALLARNLSRNGVAAQILGAAVVGTAGRYAVDRADQPGANRVLPSASGEVEGITLTTVLDRAGLEQVDLMKVDIEGAEREVLGSAADWSERVRALIMELHDGLAPADVERLLGPLGYRRLPLPERVRFDDLVCFVRA